MKQNLHFYLVSLNIHLLILSMSIVYLASVLEDGGNKEWVEMDRKWLEEQKKEFHEMDENNDGVLTKDELLVKKFFLLV
jgi:hypothetical protein